MRLPSVRTRWILGGCLYLGVAIVAAAVSAWPGFVAAVLLSVVLFVIAGTSGRSSAA